MSRKTDVALPFDELDRLILYRDDEVEADALVLEAQELEQGVVRAFGKGRDVDELGVVDDVLRRDRG